MKAAPGPSHLLSAGVHTFDMPCLVMDAQASVRSKIAHESQANVEHFPPWTTQTAPEAS